MNVDEICVDLDATDDHELSQYSHFSSLEFSCGCCDQRFKSEAALRAHLQTKKHQRNSLREQKEEEALFDGNTIEHDEVIE